MTATTRYNVFVSFHSDDVGCRDRFAGMLGDRIVDRSVKDGDIDTDLSAAEIRRQIRDDFIADAAVTVVLIGRCTWRRKYVDWEIGASLTDTRHNDRCGLLGILLPTHPDYGKKLNPRLIPPRLARNWGDDESFASLYDWTDNAAELTDWIDQAYRRRDMNPPPDNSYTPFAKNRKTKCSKGWLS